MPLSAGDKLGPYEILAPIGAGGMGEVYRAHDPRLRRDVAIKVSAERFSERFEKEARAIASLNHTNVCTLHDVGPNYLVMELVEGHTLAERLKQGALPLDEALAIAKQIADALEAAHEKGITHRDLKPGNIIIKPDGGVKVLDFGLAKMGGTPTAQSDNSPTLTVGATQAGVILGTAAYMAPEQARGKEVDRRADIWAFGVVLCEMLTGQKLFKGDDLSETLASVIKEEPKLGRAPAQTQRLLRCCLEKDPTQRLQSIADWRLLLDDSPASSSAANQGAGGWIWKAATGVAVLIALGLGGWMYFKTQPPAQTSRFEVALPQNVSFSQYVSVSPDGRKLAFNSTGEHNGLWIRDLDALQWRQLPGTDGAVSPFWSPDSKYLGFGVQNQLKKIDVSGGPAQTLCMLPAGAVGSGAWNRDGIIIFGGRGSGPLWKVSQAGGVATPITSVDASRGEAFHALPTFMPDGKHFIYLRNGSPEVIGMYAGSLDTKPTEQSNSRFLAGQFAASYVNSYLFFMRDNTLMAQPFDAAKLQLIGEPSPVAEHVGTTQSIGVFSVSPSGTLAYRAGAETGNYQLTWFDRQGKVLSPFGQPGGDEDIALSPDGTHGAVRDTTTGGAGDLWTLDFARGVRTRFTFRQSAGSWGVWSPDGSRIAFSAGTLFDTLYDKASSGAGDEKELLKEPGKIHFPTSWSRDGRFLLYYITNAPKTGSDMWVLPLQGDHKPALLLGTDFNERQAAFSPDMRWIAYASNESGRAEIYVRPFLASGPSGAPALGEGKWQVSKDGGDFPIWRADGKEIFFQAPPAGSAKMAVEVKVNGAAFEAGIPQRLFQGPIDFGWDVAADGKRFLMSVLPLGQQAAQVPITVVLNWPTQLKRN
ncbi:MAG: serine/threonine-protein kinase [Acidobacteriia bacterium]|nr:serine/threonine-protein kinase [Terriglobia bacterium]